MKFPESKHAHQLLDGLIGIEIGGSAHNPFNIPGCKYVDYTDDMDTVFKQEEIKLCGEALPVDIVAPAWDLPFNDGELEFVLSSHVIEHCWDPIGTVKEWLRVLRPGGIIFMIVPHKERTFDKDRERTPYQELVDRHEGKIERPEFDTHEHYSVWTHEDWAEICRKKAYRKSTVTATDDKVGNGFEVVIWK